MGGTNDEVLALLAAYPQAAGDKQVDLSDSDNDAESETLQEGDPLLLLSGNKPAKVAPPLPLHYAIMEMRPQKVLKALLDAYPDAAKEKMKDGRLPIEVCAKKKASKGLMLALYKADPKSRVEGLLPLGRVLNDGSSDEVVLAVLQAYPEAAKETFSTKCDVFILPLHIAHEDECSEEVKKALLDAYPDAKEVENPFKTTLRLHKLLEDTSPDEDVLLEDTSPDEDVLLEDTSPDEDVLELIKNYPDAVGKRGRDGRRPLHIALMHKASQDVTSELFYAYPQAAKERMEDGRLPIQLCAERNMSKDLMLALLKYDMPVSIEDGTPVEHSGSWIACVSSKDEVIRLVIKDFFCFCDHINALADVRDAEDRTALSLAAKGPRAVIYEYLYLCGRYKLSDGPPEHRTATSVILRAQDYGDQSDYDAIFEEVDDNGNGKLDRKELKAITVKIGLDPDLFLKGSKESDESISKETFVGICKQLLGDGPREVVIKLMKNKDHWKRERRAREENNLSPKYVVSTLPNGPSDKEIADAVKEGKGGLKTIQDKFLKDIVLGKYAIVMGAGPRNLLQIFYQEQPKIDTVRHIILKQVFEAVKHLHEEKLMHGDIKMLNIIRLGLDNKLRLIDFDASARMEPSGGEEESFAGASAKFSSAILPPEMIYRIETEEQLEKFKKYWESENDADLKKKVEPKPYKKQGTVKARYVVKSFRTEEGKPTTPVFEGLPYEDEELVLASENIDVWSLGVLAFTLLTGEPLIPSNLEDDCLSGTAMHLLKSWGTQPEVLSDRFNKIHDVPARDLVMQLLQRDPAKRPTVASLLDKHPFFHPELSAGTEDQFREMKEYLQNLTNQVEIIHRNVLVIKELSHKSQSELLRTRRVLLKGIFEATEVRTPTTFIILNNKLPLAADPSDEEAKNKILEIIAREDGSGVSMKTKQATLTATAEGVEIDLEGDLKEYRDQVEAGVKWAKRIKNIGKNFVAGNIDEVFDNIKDGIKDLIVGNEMYLYLIDDLTGDPVQAEGWPLVITTPSDVVPRLLPLMQLGMIGLSFYNGTAGMARLFGYPLPRVPKEWSKGAQETVELLKQESSVEEFSVLHEEVKEGSGEKKSVRGESLRIFMDFLDKEDPGLKVGKTGHFAGLQRFGDDQGTALWTVLTNKKEIENKLQERTKQYEEEEERTQNERNRQEEMTESMVVTKEDTNEEISEVVDLPAVSSNGRSIDGSRDTSKAMATEKKCMLSDAKKEAAKERSAADEEDIAAVGSEETELAKGSKNATAASKGVTSAPATGNVYHVNFCNDCCTIT
ncbi:serine/threonine-protein kinase [Skeletonema marinoi]|uniref:Serine/threonine-protein kinase n=1 Tax=Skeletonema marinoi TaxID=267567 RepID=A0AAD9DIR4_9STRA|nr:serine/threonine-protein kinase [Skeletonema marinoi]